MFRVTETLYDIRVRTSRFGGYPNTKLKPDPDIPRRSTSICSLLVWGYLAGQRPSLRCSNPAAGDPKLTLIRM
jgi:hypothetical protein